MKLERWIQANRNLVAKSIGELTYEEVLRPEVISEGLYRLKLASGVSYEFKGWMTLWGHLRVDALTLVRDQAFVETAGQFFIDAKVELKMTDLILGQFLDEMNSTLYSDVQMLSRAPSASEMTEWSGDEIQAVLNGHPKILLNKGRMGWGASDLAHYAPESQAPFQMHWLAARKTLTQAGLNLSNSDELLTECMNPEEQVRFKAYLKTLPIDPTNFYFIPVHPWQYDQHIVIQYASELARQNLISIGVFGDHYLPQVSIRTLSNQSRPERCDLKLPLTILNTSAVRGIPSRYIQIAPELSRAMNEVCSTDLVLKQLGTEVLNEKAGFSFSHPLFQQIEGAPYRYQEMLGAIWRESVSSKLKEDEKGILTASLFFQDSEKKSLIGAYIRKSGLTTAQWLRSYFEAVVIPLYHLQTVYGVGLVAHGQNIVLKLKDFKPAGIFIKDFQGDLRLSKTASPQQNQYFSKVSSQLDQLPPEHLIHDLITGHFLTVLRFISATLQESDQFSEKEFYSILADSIRAYGPSQNLLAETFHRVLLNPVRFKIGYADASERPLPMLGSMLKNPLVGAQ